MVGERSNCEEGIPEGVLERLEVRMPVLVTNAGENPAHRLSKVFWARVVHPELVGT